LKIINGGMYEKDTQIKINNKYNIGVIIGGRSKPDYSKNILTNQQTKHTIFACISDVF